MPLHKLVLGAAQFGLNYGLANRTGVPSYDELRKIKSVAEKLGIKALDTASSYGGSEKAIGQVFDKSWTITTKCSMRSKPREPATGLREQVHDSLALLKHSYLDNLLLHHAKDINSGWDTLRNLKDEGLVKKIGVSLYFNDDLDAVLSLPDLDVVQITLNVFDQRFLKIGALNCIKDKGVEVHVRSIFLQGLLLMQPDQRPSYFSKWSKNFALIDGFLQQQNVSAKELCINFVAHLAMVDKIVVGVETADQLAELGQCIRDEPIPVSDFLACSDPKLLDPFLWQI